ncbi:ABC transporter ATP-binding protein [Brevundimonas vesicularis]|uniref:ABC transporter ATP-binding protein n=1 Tax=Brevundimonas vesicularis TaxID=41276 RepID=A0A1Z3U4Y4_BREVE|nr:ABC transporter ATP-binding protein [Brevundimonas vesicularis]ASE38328.1 ABC transporter ATP-binding protein [Brevundimonas vesicularis]MDX2333583.1 ABC transporter ATP-binding protein [Brevundimonas vesicularis]
MYAIDRLQIGYGKNVLSTLEQVVVEPGEFICLLGRNGQGKSTLLRTLGGFIPAVDGEARLDGRPVRQWSAAERARKVAVVLTDRPQVGALRVHELVEMGRQPYTGWTGSLSEEDREICVGALEQVEGEHLRDRFVDSLSDGERQRIMIARGLAQRPQVMLLDEITAFLDLPSRVTIMATLRRIAHETGVSILLSSHDLELSLSTADRIWLLPGEGRFVDGAPEDVALSGAIGTAFDQANVAFSMTSGRFETRGTSRGSVFVEAEEPAAVWLGRAAKRMGLGISASAAGADFVIRHSSQGYEIDGQTYLTIRSLNKALTHR